MAKLVSKTYGEALFDLAKEEGKLDVISEEVQFVSDSLNENKDLMRLLNHPKITVEEKIEVVESIFKGRLSDTTTGFLVLVVQKGRSGELPEILSYFTKKVKEYKNIGVASITSATALSEKQKADMEKKLLETTRYVSFETRYDVDESLIGGVVIRIGDRVVDSSIRTKLDNMAKALINS